MDDKEESVTTSSKKTSSKKSKSKTTEVKEPAKRASIEPPGTPPADAQERVARIRSQEPPAINQEQAGQPPLKKEDMVRQKKVENALLEPLPTGVQAQPLERVKINTPSKKLSSKSEQDSKTAQSLEERASSPRLQEQQV